MAILPENLKPIEDDPWCPATEERIAQHTLTIIMMELEMDDSDPGPYSIVNPWALSDLRAMIRVSGSPVFDVMGWRYDFTPLLDKINGDD